METNNPTMPMSSVPTVPSVPMPSAGLPKAGQILKEAWAIYKARAKTLIAISLVPFAGFFIFGLLFGAGAIATKTFKPDPIGIGLIGVILALIMLVVLIYLSLWSTVAGLFAIKDHTEMIGWKESFKRSKIKIGAFFITGLLSGLAVFGGMILLIVPGIIFALWFSQSGYIVVTENLSGSAALKQSKAYVKGRLGTVFGKYFYIGLISLLCFLLVSIIISILSRILGIKTEHLTWLSNLFSVVWTPLVTVYSYLLYGYLKDRR